MLSQFEFLKSIFCYTLIQLSSYNHFTNSQQTCLNDNRERPSIVITDNGAHPFLPLISVENATGTVTGINLICNHTSPIQWTTDFLNHPVNQFNARKSFFRRFQNPMKNSTTMFLGSFEFLYSRRFKKPVVISCEPVLIKNANERIFVVIIPGTPLAEAYCTADHPELQELPSQVRLSYPKPGINSICKIELFLKTTNESGLQFKWKTTSSESQPLITQYLVTNQVVIFENSFRLVDQIPSHCVKMLGSDEICNGCEKVYEDVINAIVLHARYGIDEWVFRGLFNLSSEKNGPRKLFPIGSVNLDEMINLETPSIMYVNKSEDIICSVSIMYFAYGSMLTSADDLKPENPIEEVYKEDGRREFAKKFTFFNGNELKNISCSAPLWRSKRNVVQTHQVYVEYPEAPMINGSLEMDEITVPKHELNLTIICTATGNPVPIITWKLPNEVLRNTLIVENDIEKTIAHSRLTFPQFGGHCIGIYICEASNFLGTDSKRFDIQLPLESLSHSTKVVMGTGLGIFILVFGGVIFFIQRKIIIQRKLYRAKKFQAIQEFKEGIKQQENKQSKKTMMNQDLYVLEQPYDDKFEIPEDHWLIEDKVLGQGAFGIVRKGEVEINDKKVLVAIKTLKSSVDIDDFKSFLFELKVMVYMGKNTNIVSLVAACTQNINQCNVMIGVEFCTNGSLSDYLANKRSLFQANSPEILQTSSSQGTYANLFNAMSLTEHDLYVWAYQIASGMEYLDTKKVLHGDLATRNVLLTSDKTAKISDFGLSRVLLETSNYTKKSRTPLPWKWMPMESLRHLRFSGASDVWAYGVTLWEIFSLGESPYAGLHFSSEFITQLEQGLRLGKPSKASNYVYEVMKHCWHDDPLRRLDFSDLKTRFSRILQIFNDNSSFDMESLPFLDHTPIPQPRGITEEPLGIDQLYSNIHRASNAYLNC